MSEAQPSYEPHDLVVIGSSAGGVEALSILVSTLPADFPAPLVLAQHVDPTRPSQLPDILQRATKLNVVVVSEQTPMEKGHIYLVPSNLHVQINSNGVGVETDMQNRPRPSVDLLLATAAETFGEHLYAVILTGSGSDGAVGAVEVKNHGGTVIIQNPTTARYPSMPMSLPPTAVDHVVNTEEISPLLVDLLSNDNLKQRHEQIDITLRSILGLISQQAKIDFRPYKESTIIRRIGRRMIVTQTRSMRQYMEYLQAHPDEIGELIGSFLINVTQFFRDPEAFTMLRQHVLPELIARARNKNRELRFWSAGCATGEEPYSLAMLLADMLGDEIEDWRIRIFATDLDGPAISYARAGVYPENVLRNVPDDYRNRFFVRLDNSQGFRISKMLRQMVIFGQQNLGRSSPFPRIDLVLCRNVLIYFTTELQDHVLSNFAFSLQPQQGYLFLGKAETVRLTLPFYEVVDKQLKLYRCIDSRLPSARLPGTAVLPAPAIDVMKRLARPIENPADGEAAVVSDLVQVRRSNESLLRHLPFGVVVIDRSYHILSMNPIARRLLNVRDVVTDHDFLHAARGLPYTEVRNAIDNVFRERTPVHLHEVRLDVPHGETEQYVRMSLVLMPAENNMPELVIISVNDATEQVQSRRQLEVVQQEQVNLVGELEPANRRLNDANKELIDANKELIDANEELQIANEELVLTQEELQATIEEFETTNEELQATNEELRATAAEVEFTTRELETERARLVAMVELTPFYTLRCRGPLLIVENVDPRFLRYSQLDKIQGRPLREAAPLLWDSSLQIVELAQQAYNWNTLQISPRFSVVTTNEAGERAEEFFVMTIVPMLDGDRNVEGVIIYAANETLRRIRERDAERERLQLIFERMQQVALVLYDAQTTKLLTASPRYLELSAAVHKIDPQSVIGRTVTEIAINPEPDPLTLWRQVIDSGQSLHRPEVVTSTPDGETVWDWTLTPIVEPQQPDVVRYMLVSAVEVTQQVRARRELERLDRLKDEFLSSASHELRTPLTTLIGYSHIMRQLLSQISTTEPAVTSRLVQYMDTFSIQLNMLNRLVGDLVDVSRLQNGKLSISRDRIALQSIIARLAHDGPLMGAKQPVRVEMPPEDDPVWVDGDADRLYQVMGNLLQNAITYAPHSDHFDLRLRHVVDDGGASWAQVEVQDYGPGIAPEDREAVFGRLYQILQGDRRARKGMGLGLYIARQIVEQHNGTLTVESIEGEGSTFVIRIPLAG